MIVAITMSMNRKSFRLSPESKQVSPVEETKEENTETHEFKTDYENIIYNSKNAEDILSSILEGDTCEIDSEKL